MGTVMTIVYTAIIFGVIITIHEFGHFIFAKIGGIKVNEFSIGMGPKVISKQKDETLYALRLFPIGGYVSMEGEDEESEDDNSFGRKPILTRISVIAAGAILNLILGLVLLFSISITRENLVSNKIVKFTDNAISNQEGLKVDDEIVAINNKNINISNDIIYYLTRDKDSVVDITVKRDDEKVVLKDIKFNSETLENGQKTVDIDFRVGYKENSFFSSIKQAFFESGSMVKMIIDSVGDLFTGKVSVAQLSGPVGVAGVIGQAATFGVLSLLNIAAFLSINIGIFNLLPLPALDGGRLVFLGIELVRGKPIKQKYEGYIHAAGLIILLGIMLLVTFQDVFKIISG
ncbi:MAG: RIP metalloprotease RseP [Oscillospiraceae bacterium]